MLRQEVGSLTLQKSALCSTSIWWPNHGGHFFPLLWKSKQGQETQNSFSCNLASDRPEKTVHWDLRITRRPKGASNLAGQLQQFKPSTATGRHFNKQTLPRTTQKYVRSDTFRPKKACSTRRASQLFVIVQEKQVYSSRQKPMESQLP